jgi:hypothetical protein
MSKSPEMNDLPPSYSDSISPSPSTQPSYLSAVLNPLSTHLHTLPERIHHSNAVTHSTQADKDLGLLSHILPHIESFLLSSDIAAARAGIAQLVIVPLSAVPAGWTLSDVDDRANHGEIIRVARIDVTPDPATAAKDSEKGGKRGDQRLNPARPEFDDWGRFDDSGGSSSDNAPAPLWWRDEAMARRLAAYLQPKEQVKPAERKEMIQAEAVQQREQRKGLFGWGRKTTTDAKAASQPAAASPKTPVTTPLVGQKEGVSMTVRANEVTFRKENEFGVWETRNGVAVVVTIKVRKV